MFENSTERRGGRGQSRAGDDSSPPASVATLPPVAPVPAGHDPSWLIQRAWSVYRLPRLQELVRQTIADLGSRPPPELSNEPEAALHGAERDPVVEALRACCEELREAAGTPGAETDRARHCLAVSDYIQGQPLAWGEAFTDALGKYRRAAASALEAAFSRAVAA